MQNQQNRILYNSRMLRSIYHSTEPLEDFFATLSYARSQKLLLSLKIKFALFFVRRFLPLFLHHWDISYENLKKKQKKLGFLGSPKWQKLSNSRKVNIRVKVYSSISSRYDATVACVHFSTSTLISQGRNTEGSIHRYTFLTNYCSKPSETPPTARV